MLNTMPQGANILDVDLTNPENSIFIPVNTVGVMGKGLALDFKKMYPSYFKEYALFCGGGHLKTGLPLILGGHYAFPSAACSIPANWGGSGLIVLFPTKDDWRKPSQLDWIKQGLVELAVSCNSDYHGYVQWRKQTRNIHIPKLGCGLGGLEWADVRKIVEQFADCMPEHEIYLYE
jgi:hypothetical protein